MQDAAGHKEDIAGASDAKALSHSHVTWCWRLISIELLPGERCKSVSSNQFAVNTLIHLLRDYLHNKCLRWIIWVAPACLLTAHQESTTSRSRWGEVVGLQVSERVAPCNPPRQNRYEQISRPECGWLHYHLHLWQLRMTSKSRCGTCNVLDTPAEQYFKASCATAW